MTKILYTRRIVIGTTVLAVAGCLAREEVDDDGREDADSGVDDDGGEDADVDFEPEPTGSIEAIDQEGHGDLIVIDHATANVDYYLLIQYAGHSIESDEITGDEEVSLEVAMSPEIDEETNIDVEVRSAENDEVLDSTTIQYSIALPQPELTVESSRAIADEIIRSGPPWRVISNPSLDEADSFLVDVDSDGYVVEINYKVNRIQRAVRYSSEERTEAWLCRANAEFLRGYFTSEYPITEVIINASLDSEIDSAGNRTYETAQTVRMSAHVAENIDWMSFIEDLDPWENLPDVADEYTWQWYEDPT